MPTKQYPNAQAGDYNNYTKDINAKRVNVKKKTQLGDISEVNNLKEEINTARYLKDVKKQRELLKRKKKQ